MHRLVARIAVRSALAAASPFFVALLFVTVHVFDFDWGGRLGARDLELAMTYEVLLIHAFAFLGMFAVVRPVTRAGKLGRPAAFFSLFALYLLTGYREDGGRGVLMVLGLGLATYAGLFFRVLDDGVAVQLGVRWLLNSLSLLPGVGLAVGLWVQIVEGRGAPGITEEPAVGIGYFALLGTFELFRVYDLLTDRAPPLGEQTSVSPR